MQEVVGKRNCCNRRRVRNIAHSCPSAALFQMCAYNCCSKQDSQLHGQLFLILTVLATSFILTIVVFFFHSAIGECDKAIEVYSSIPLTDFDGIVGIALAYFKKGLLQESIKGKHLPKSQYCT